LEIIQEDEEPGIIEPLRKQEIYVDQTCKFECELTSDAWEPKWFKDGQALPVDGKRIVSKNIGRRYCLTIADASEADAGNYQIQITENVKDSARLVVHPLPSGFKKALEDMTAKERDAKVTFDIVTDNDVEVEWLINDQLVSKSSEKYSIEIEHGRFHCFSINNLKKSDDCIVTARIPQSGAECSARLFVHALDVAVKKPMVEQEVFEGEAAMFDLELSHEDVEGFWYRDGIEIEKHDEKYEMSTKGKKTHAHHPRC
jgi:hypothetical protein